MTKALKSSEANHVRRGELEHHYATKADLSELKGEMIRWDGSDSTASDYAPHIRDVYSRMDH